MKNRICRMLVVFTVMLVTLLPLCSESRAALAECNHNWIEVHNNAPTCATSGARYIECSICGTQKTEQIPATGNHNWETVGETKPNCYKAGAKYSKCSICGAQKTEPIPATGIHNWIPVSETKPTCTKAGVKYWDCTVCGESKSEEIPATGNHDWKETQYTAPTCGTKGSRRFVCSVCGGWKTEEIPATGNHSWILNDSLPATCSKPGEKCYICSECGTSKTEKIDALGHDWKEVQYTAPTCSASGARYLECSRCGEQKTETIPATGKHTYTEISRVNATCDSDGKAVKKCSVCGREETEILKAEDQHKWVEVSKTPATCVQNGSRELRCSKCGRTKTETLSATGKHEYSDWVVVKEATNHSTGRRERVCGVCGKVESEIIRLGGKNGNSGTTIKIPDNDVVKVYTSTTSVNLRQGPSKKSAREEQIAKKNTDLGELQGAEIDSNGTVWYRILYKNKTRYVTCEFAYAVCGTPSDNRPVTGKATELNNVFMKSTESAFEKMNLTGAAGDGYDAVASAEGLTLYGNTVIEKVELSGSGYTFCGVKIGDAASSAKVKLKDAGMWLEETYDDMLIFEHVCSPDSLAITELGFDGIVMVEIDGGKVVSMIWEAYTD